MGIAISTANNSLYLSISHPTDDDGSRRDDVIGAKIWASKTNGFTPSSSNLVHDGASLSCVLPNLDNGAAYYVRYAVLSAIDPDNYATSDQVAAPLVNDASAAAVMSVSSSHTIISQATDGAFSPGAVTFSAASVVGNGAPEPYSGRFVVSRNGVAAYTSSTDETSCEYVITDGTTSVSVILYAAGGTTTRLDSMTVPVVADGAAALSFAVSNASHTIPCDASGAPTSYVGSGTDIFVYYGDQALIYDGVGTAKGAWKAVASGSGITPGSPSDAGDYVTFGAHSAMTQDVATVTYTVSGRRPNGVTFSRLIRQNLTKAKNGATGATGPQGPTGPQGVAGPAGATGAAGVPGSNVAIVTLYQRAASTPTIPSVTTTFTFATAILTGANNGWTQIIPATDGNPLWVTTASAVSSTATDNIGAGEWSAPVKMAQDGATGPQGATGATGPQGATGAPGLNSASVFLYKRSSTTPAVPTASTTYTFSTGVLTNITNGWTQAVPATDGYPLWVTTATASAITATDTIQATEWAAPSKLAQDGTTGSRGSGIFYAPATSAAWSDTTANNRITTVTGSATKMVGDTVTLTYGTEWTMTKTWDGSAWQAAGTVIDGALLVTGSVSSAKIDTRELSIKDAYGTLRAYIGADGNLQLAGDVYASGGDMCSVSNISLRGSGGATNAARVSAFGHADASSFRGSAQLKASMLDSSGNIMGSAPAVTAYGNSASGTGYGGDNLAGTVHLSVGGSQYYGFTANYFVSGKPIKVLGVNSNRVLCTDANKLITHSSVTDTELGCLSGVTSSVQEQINSHTHATLPNCVTVLKQGGAEGGEIHLQKPESGSTLGGDVVIDVVNNAFRIFENGGSFRGLYVDLATGADGTGSKIWHAGNDGAGSGLDADKLDGFHADTTNTANTVVARDASGNFSAATITASAFSGSGADLTNVDALNLRGYYPTSTNTVDTIVRRDSSGCFSAGTITAALAGNATTATSAGKLTTSRSITVGSTTRSFDGSANILWTLSDVGAAAESHTHAYLPLSGGTLSGSVNVGGNNVSNVGIVACNSYCYPTTDNTGGCGAATKRWATIFSATSTINTSDARQKTSVVALSGAEIAVAVELSKRIGMFQFLDAIAAKGQDVARWHIGVTVQEVADLFVAHGLDPWQYGFMCYDSWDAGEENENSGDRYSFRISELLLFIATGINERLARLENAGCWGS